MKGNEAYLRIQLKNAKMEQERYETRLYNIRHELHHHNEAYLIAANKVAHIEAMLKELYGPTDNPNQIFCE
jgi:hypothetical protein